eukprot:2671136-Rhodomonas_salina.1
MEPRARASEERKKARAAERAGSSGACGESHSVCRSAALARQLSLCQHRTPALHPGCESR